MSISFKHRYFWLASGMVAIIIASSRFASLIASNPIRGLVSASWDSSLLAVFLFVNTFIGMLSFLYINHYLIWYWLDQHKEQFVRILLIILINLALIVFLSIGFNRLLVSIDDLYFFPFLHFQFSLFRSIIQCFTALVLLYMLHLIETSRRITRENWELKEESHQAQLNALQAQVNPHFLYNALSALTGIIRRNQKEESIVFVEHLSQYFRYTLSPRKSDLVSLADELDFLSSYIFMLKERFANKLQVTINLPDQLLSTQIPPLALQMLVENAVKHNLISKKSPLAIHISQKGNKISVSNQLQPLEPTIKSMGIGLQNLSRRYQLLARKPITIEKKEGQFIISLPIIEI